MRRRDRRTLAAALGATLLATTSIVAASPDDIDKRFEAMQREIDALRTRNDDLQSRLAAQETTTIHNQRLAEERADANRKLVEDVLRDADRRSDLSDARLAAFQDAEDGIDEVRPAAADMVKDDTGTDPRDFSSKFMPYYRYTELENNLEVNELTLFGMVAFNPRFAMTFEVAVAKQIDYSDVDAFKNMPDFNIAPGDGFSPVPSGGVPFADLDPDGDVVGMGDLNLRFFYRPEALEWSFDDGNSMGKAKGVSLMPVMEFMLPTATDAALGGEALILSPGFTVVTDIPGDAPFGLGFFAMMNFLDFDAFKDDGRKSTTRFRGRWFWMQPLTKPGPNLADGLYILTEFQPVYDFMTSDFDLWIAPEFGKATSFGAVYFKPGWGIDTESTDRDFTFETGFRYFF